MKSDLLKLKSDNEDYIEHVWWKYNLNVVNELSDEMIHILTMALDSFIDKVYYDYEILVESTLMMYFKEEIGVLRKICPYLEEEAFYDYGGLNEFFIRIAMCFDFFKKEMYMNHTDMLYDCINGKPF